MCELAAAGCDRGDGENIVDSCLAGGVDGANACPYKLYCQTVYHPLMHKYKRVREATRLTD